MVFTRLSAQEKEAFFGLLDEYFQSRPELFQGHGAESGLLAGTGVSATAAASAVQRALAANAAPSSSLSSSPSIKSNNLHAANMSTTPSAADIGNAVSLGRVAAASLAFSGGGGGGGSGASTTTTGAAGDVPALPRRTSGSVPNLTPPRITSSSSLPGSEVDKLMTKKTSVLNAFKKPQLAGVAIPPAFAAPKNTYGPPPIRRVTSETSTGSGSGTRASPAPPPAAVPEPEVEEEEGEWAEVLYDYNSEDPADLAIEAGTRVLVTTKSSEDWWSGKIEGQGREGLFPASYVKLL